MPSSSSNRAAMLVLAYLWPLALVPLLLERDDAGVQWHAKHGLVLMGAEILVLFGAAVIMSLASLMTFSFGCALGLLIVALWIAILGLHLAAILRALAGSRLIVPYISELADHL